VKKKSVSETAALVLDRIPSSRFWTKGSYDGGNGGERRCVLGAVRPEVEGTQYVAFTNAFVAKAKELFPYRQFRDIPGFNDHDETRYEDVRVVLEKLRAE